MDPEEKKRISELSDLEKKYGDIAEDLEEKEDPNEPMPMQSASLRDVDRIREKRREQRKK